MGRNKLVINLFGMLFCFLLTSCSSIPYFFKDGNHLLWKVSDENSSVWLFGSIHFADSSFYPLPSEIENAFRNSTALAVEMDISDSETQEKTAEEFLKEGMFTDGRTLKDVLPDSLWKTLDSISTTLGMKTENFLPMRPWMAATLIASAAIASTGIQQELGIDMVMLDSAYVQGKEIIALETPEEQVESLSKSEGSEETDGIAYLESTFREYSKLNQMIKEVISAWKRADVVSLQKSLSADQNMNESEKRLNERMFNQRNKKMKKEILNFLENDKQVFVVVGVGHLILENNLLEMLSENGLKIQRY
ncbi:MAG: TraB/GumN family protein [Fibrobacteraceae bacterium]|nr:TraB/GumN family protein [Fibrobacteraceae bacterium]